MYELIRLTENDHYFDCPAKVGLVKIGGNEVCLIDGGSDKDAGKKILRVLNENGWNLKVILVTHSHADHIGGCRFLREKTGCSVYAKGLENVFTNTPALEPIGLYGGNPLKELKNKFLSAPECAALPLTQDVLPEGMTLIDLPGHSFDMTGFITRDGTAYVADCVSSAETIAKYGVGYLWDVGASLDTLGRLGTIPAKRFVPAHAPVCEDITALAELNERSILGVIEKILSVCVSPASFEDILKKIFDAYSLTLSAQQYALVGSTIRSYLTYLASDGRLVFEFTDNKMLWRSVE